MIQDTSSVSRSLFFGAILLFIFIPGAVHADPNNLTRFLMPESVIGLGCDGFVLPMTGDYGFMSVEELTEGGFSGARTITIDEGPVYISINGTFFPDEKGFVISDTGGGVQVARIVGPDTFILSILSLFPESDEETAGADGIIITLHKTEENPDSYRFFSSCNMLLGAMVPIYQKEMDDQRDAETAGKEQHELYAGSQNATECDENACYCEGKGCHCQGMNVIVKEATVL
ncbi:MAG: hypothetical protein JXA44_05560 [Methanospirillaceae archaeon]|nr:hypothetical protein [Methanospirillaceae archaeon]